MGILTKAEEKEQQETLLQSKIYEEGLREGREKGLEEAKALYEVWWKDYIDRECQRRCDILFTENGYETIQNGFRPTKEDINSLGQVLLSPHYPMFKKVILGYAQNAYRMAGMMHEKNPHYAGQHANLGNLLTGFLTALEALSVRQEPAPKDEWTA